jgi:hypothetical protein
MIGKEAFVWVSTAEKLRLSTPCTHVLYSVFKVSVDLEVVKPEAARTFTVLPQRVHV